jgi:hypothetical protein
LKKIYLFLFLFASAGGLQAQSFKFGVCGGVNWSNLYYSKTEGATFSNLTGFNAGAFADFNWRKITIESGLYYTAKGYNDYDHLLLIDPYGTNYQSVSNYTAYEKVTLNDLEIPLNLLYNFKTSVGKVFLGGGPYVDYALSGRITGNSTEVYQLFGAPTTTHESTSSNALIGSADYYFKKTYPGVNAVGGFQLKNGLQLAVKYAVSLENITNDGPNATGTFKYYGVSASVGYMFF